MNFNAKGPLGVPRYSSIGPFTARRGPDSIMLDLNGRRIDGINISDDRLDFEIVNKEYNNQFIGVTIYATLTDGSEINASMEIDPYQGRNLSETGNRAHLFHLKVPKKMRGKGIGSTLMEIFKTYVISTGFVRVSGRVGNHGTSEFMQKNGINSEALHIIDVPSDIGKSVVIGTKEDARESEGQPPAEGAEGMRGVPLDVAFQEVKR